MTLREEIRELLERSKVIKEQETTYSPIFGTPETNGVQTKKWMNDVLILSGKLPKEHPLVSEIQRLYRHKGMTSSFPNMVSILESLKEEQHMDELTNHQDQLEYDVFLSHANADKENLIEELNTSLKKLGIKIFYDKEELEWGDNWKDRILNGTKKAEFAIIVISQNFFDREWTERELNEFLNRQNQNGQKLILPILHNITIQQLKEKYPSVADIQAIDSSKYTCDQIALLFARQLIHRLKSV